MKKTRKIFFLAFMFMLAITGCNQKNNSNTDNSENYNYDPFAVSSPDKIDESQIDIQYRFGFKNWDGSSSLVLEDKTSFELYIENAGSDNNFGFMIFINGIAQPYTLDNTDTAVLHPVEVGGNATQNVNLTFTPLLDGNEVQTIYIGCVANPNFSPQTIPTIFGNNHKLAQLNSSSLVCASDLEPIVIQVKKADASEKIPAEIQALYIEKDENNKVVRDVLKDSMQMRVLKNNIGEEAITDPKGVFYKKNDELTLQLLGGAANTWRVSMYVDHVLVAGFDSNEYIDMDASSSTFSSVNVKLNDLQIESGYHSVCFIAVPLIESAGNQINKSSSYVYIGE